MPFTQSGLPFSEPTTSRDAALAAEAFAETQEAAVEDFVRRRGAYGATQKEAAHEMYPGDPDKRGSMCARFAMLVAKRHIVRNDEKRDKCRVYVHVEVRP